MTQGLTLEDQIVVAIRRIIRAIDVHSKQLVEQVGLTGPQLMTLKVAAELGTASVGALAKAVHLSGPTLTGILDRLVRRGLINRVTATRDRRSVVITVTEKGYETLASAPSLLQERFRQKLEGLAEWERTMLLAAIQRMAAMMEAGEMEDVPVLDGEMLIDASVPGETPRIAPFIEGESISGGHDDVNERNYG